MIDSKLLRINQTKNSLCNPVNYISQEQIFFDKLALLNFNIPEIGVYEKDWRLFRSCCSLMIFPKFLVLQGKCCSEGA